jgi:hypothetical protein
MPELNYILPDGSPLKLDSPPYSLPAASATVLGGVKVGTGLSIANGILNNAYSGSGITTTSLAANGYVKFANGLILQWGAASNMVFSEAEVAPNNNFPIAFTAIYAFVMTRRNGLTGHTNDVAAVFTTTKYGAYKRSDTVGISATYTWIAIGK